MTVIYLTEYNTRSYGVFVQNNGSIKVQKFENNSDDEKKSIFCEKPLKTFLGKSQRCDMTLILEALDKSVFDGNTILDKIGQENDKHSYV